MAEDADGGEEGDDGGVEFESFDDVVLQPWHFLLNIFVTFSFRSEINKKGRDKSPNPNHWSTSNSGSSYKIA